MRTLIRMSTRCAWLVFAAVIVAAAPSVAQSTPQPPSKPGDGKFGVGMVPYMDGGYFFWDSKTKADSTERSLYRLVGDMPEIDRMYAVNDSEHLLQTLAKLKKAGRALDYLVLAGHGSRDTPGIKWGKDEMIPEEVDLEWNKEQLRRATEILKNPSKSNMKPQELRKRRDELTARVALLESVSGMMAPNATVLLINCSAAATDRGRHFVRAFGQVLLGKHGGSIVASKRDISIFEVDWWAKGIGYLVRQWKMPSWGETRVWGDWVSFGIAAAAEPRGFGVWAGNWRSARDSHATLTLSGDVGQLSGTNDWVVASDHYAHTKLYDFKFLTPTHLTCLAHGTYVDTDKTVDCYSSFDMVLSGDTIEIMNKGIKRTFTWTPGVAPYGSEVCVPDRVVTDTYKREK